MKISNAEFLRLKDEILQDITEKGVTVKAPEDFPFVKNQQMSWGWFILHSAQKKNNFWLYDKNLNDSHIETILKKIF